LDDIDIVGNVSPTRSDWQYEAFGLELSFRTVWQQARRAAWWLLDEKNSFQKTLTLLTKLPSKPDKQRAEGT